MTRAQEASMNGNIKHLRERKKWTQKQLARRVNLDVMTISKYETRRADAADLDVGEDREGARRRAGTAVELSENPHTTRAPRERRPQGGTPMTDATKPTTSDVVVSNPEPDAADAAALASLDALTSRWKVIWDAASRR